MLEKFFSIIILISICALTASAQNTERDSIEKEKEQVQKETELLLKQKAYLDALRSSIPASSITPPTGKITLNPNNSAPDTETAALSYEALRELSTQVAESMKAALSQYQSLIMYNEPDFLALANYRLFRHRSRIAIENYELIVTEFHKQSRGTKSSDILAANSLTLESVAGNSRGGGTLLTALNVPAIGTSYAKSVGELLSVFRTDTTITPSYVNIENTSLGTAISSSLLRSYPNLKIYYPQKFVPEYDLDTEGESSLLKEMSQIEAANNNIDNLLAKCRKLSEADRNTQPLKEILEAVSMVKTQFQPLLPSTRGEDEPQTSNTRGATADTTLPKTPPPTAVSELRQLIRAEKLDRVLRDEGNSESSTRSAFVGQVGIMQVKVLASGGSRRESRNMFLGSKVDYSGSAVIEVVLFNPDGSIRASEIFTHHTGFRKMKTKNK